MKIHRMNPAAFILAGLAALPGAALDISGTVQDKFENPQAGVKVCQQGTQTCVVTDAAGKFRLGGSSALRPARPSEAAASLRFLAGAAILRSPAATTADLRWFDAAGARLGEARGLALAAGDNPLRLPGLAPGSRAVFLQAVTPVFAVTWRLLGGNGSLPVSAGAAAAAKASAAGGLEATKDKYKPAVYVPKQETETGVVIEIRPLGDKILFDGTQASKDANWGDYSGGAWKVVDGMLKHDGGSNAVYTKENFGNFRFKSTSRRSGSGHNPNFLLWCKAGSTNKRTLEGIQFQPPLGHMWDYITNKDPNGSTMKRVGSNAGLVVTEFAMCESLANMATATIRFACCNVAAGKKTCNATEIVNFTDPKYARSGPIALMIHDSGQHQEYKDLEVEVDPIEPDRLLSVKK